MLADAGSTPAASTKLRTSNIQGSPENPVNSGFSVSFSSTEFQRCFAESGGIWEHNWGHIQFTYGICSQNGTILDEARGKLDALKQKFDVNAGGIRLMPIEVSAEIKGVEKAIASDGRRLNRDKRNADGGLKLICTFGTAVWPLLGPLNYIFFGAFRALPWKRTADDD